MISVCMPTYNGEKYIIEQLTSILSQLDKNDEIIISDDSSTDNTIELIESINDARIHILKDNHFKSPIYNMENAIKHSKGDYIFLSDQDDVWNQNKVNTMIEYLKTYDCVVSDAIIVDKDLNELYPSFFNIRNCHVGIFHNVLKNGYIGCCMAFKRSILNKALPFPPKIPMHDSWIGLISEKYGKSVFIDDKLIKYRRHGDNASSTGEKSNTSFIFKMLSRVHLIMALIKR